MELKEMLYEGKAKKVFATDNPDYVVVDYKPSRARARSITV